MTADNRLDVLAIGNAIVDVIAPADDAFLASEGLDKGAMRLIDADEATQLYGRMAAGREVSGGSAANTAAGLAALGLKAGFVGRVADDQLGEVFCHDIRAQGVAFNTPIKANEIPTARCLILVTPDGQRTMNTFLGASQSLDSDDIDFDLIGQAKILYLEGYLWDPALPRAAMRRAIDTARDAGAKVAFSLSDGFCVDRHRDDFCALIDNRQIDILFANEDEAKSLSGADSFDGAVEALTGTAEIIVITRSDKGAVVLQGGEVHAVPARAVDKVVDTTGAGDLFAAGFMAGLVKGRSVVDCAHLGAIAAAEIISHYGARPEADLKQLAADYLG